MRPLRRKALACIAALVLGGCVGGVQPQGRAPSTNEIVGAWTLVEINGRAVGPVATINFGRDGQYRATVACNQANGTYALRAGAIYFTGGEMTALGCVGGDTAAADHFERLLISRAGLSTSISGDRLILNSGSAVLVLRRS